MRDRIRIRGLVTVRVLDKDGNVKRHAPGWFGRLFGLRGRLMENRHHNIVTREGDALIADSLLAAPFRTKVTAATGYIQVGIGWTGVDAKNNTICNEETGGMQALDNGYPALKAAWGNIGDTTVVYRATFPTGSLNENGINEACLRNGDEYNSNCLAYAQITPPVNVTRSDTLQIIWEITILGQ